MKMTEDLFNEYKTLYQFEEGDPEYLIDKENFKEALKEFAKIHVEAALKAAYNNARILNMDGEYYSGSNYSLEERSVTGVYPLENIK